MAKKPVLTKLNASTIDILNTIRANASQAYRDEIPAITDAKSIPAVGDILFGAPALLNEFVGSLMNRIAFVAIKSATFYNPYADLKKGFLLTGETIEDVFVNIARVYAFDNDEPEERLELATEVPDIRTAFYAINWRVQYKISVSDEQLRPAFTSMEGVQDLINRIIEEVYVSERYDEFLLFKYLMIKSVTSGQMHPISAGDTTATAAAAFRGYSNLMTFPSRNYNEAKVLNGTPRDRQVIFMDSMYNATFDVEQLASAFNMDKTEFFGRLYLIDDWTHFDNERWADIRRSGSQVEEVTSAELALMAHVKAISLDSEWFQVYDNLLQMSNKYVAHKLTWNYFLTSFKTVAHSPFANAIVFVDDTADIQIPTDINATVTSVETSDMATVVTVEIDDADGLNGGFPQFVQDETATTAGIAVHKYGVYIFPSGQTAVKSMLNVGGKTYMSTANLETTAAVGSKLTFNTTGA